MDNHLMDGVRASGILMHISSLPGPYGIGDLGAIAYRFVDCLVATGQSYWQVLPLGPTDYVNSPYASASSFAGNPLFISLDWLKDRGWLTVADFSDQPGTVTDETNEIHYIDYGSVKKWHRERLYRAYRRFKDKASQVDFDNFNFFRLEQSSWLDDFALFSVIHDLYQKAWWEWPEALRIRENDALVEWKEERQDGIDEACFQQWLFFLQWDALKFYANERGILLVGDIPIYAAEDSSDVWANSELFDMGENGRPNHVAGVPPDYFSTTGQLWGNPIYRWEYHRRTEYAWWMERIIATLRMVDILRVDHFRAFYNYWQITSDEKFWTTPREERTAIDGTWVDWEEDDQHQFFQVIMDPDIRRRLVAENLGADMDDINTWIDEDLHLPGMQILQFAFGDDDATEGRFWPVPYDGENNHFAAMYTGTHDNNTTRGWWRQDTGENHRQEVLDLVEEWELNVDPDVTPHWALVEVALRSSTNVVIIPIQDILGLDERARMNTPQQIGWWRWIATADDVPQDCESHEGWGRLARLTKESVRSKSV